MQLTIEPTGNVRCLYSEALDLSQFGPVNIHRASHVEPTAIGHWTADLSPVNGPTLGPFVTRSQAIHAEVSWLNSHRV